MNTRFIGGIIVAIVLAGSFGVNLYADTNVVEKSFGLTIGRLGAITNQAIVRLQFHSEPDAGTNAVSVKVLSTDSVILGEKAKTIIEMWTTPDRIYGKRKNSPMTDAEGNPKYKDAMIRYVFSFSCTLKEAEGDAIGQLMKSGRYTMEQLATMAREAGLGAEPDAPANGATPRR